MKIKPLYLYGGILLLAIVFLIFFTSKDGSDSSENISTNEMPDDDIHKGLKNPMQGPPGKENVSGEIKHQLEMLKKSVEENPNDTLKMREYADLLAAAHHPEEAVIYYYGILNINPRRTDILNSLAFIYYNKKDYSKAADVINKVLLYEPDNTQAIYNLGAIAATSGNKEEARKRWELLVKKYPDSNESKLAVNSLKKL
jgi:tetratricopeptide (TPR) repeat protein